MKQILLSLAIAAVVVTTAHADAPKVKVTPLAAIDKTIIGQDVDVPKDAHAVAVIATFPPGAKLPEHKHLYPHYVYVLEGTLTVINTESGKTFTVKQGDMVAEMMNTWHYGINKTAQPVRLLVIDVLPKGTTSNMVPR